MSVNIRVFEQKKYRMFLIKIFEKDKRQIKQSTVQNE